MKVKQRGMYKKESGVKRKREKYEIGKIEIKNGQKEDRRRDRRRDNG